MLKALKARGQTLRIAERLCAAIGRRAREPVFYREFGVADTFDGRFDVLVLHAWLVLDRLREAGQHNLAQKLVDRLFQRLDEALREQGAGDMGMHRRLKKLAGAFYGRLKAYTEAVDGPELPAALARNVYRGAPAGVEHGTALARYVLEARVSLAGCRIDEGQIEFGPVPRVSEV
jgi:cytochrome b pre-mRNA-processing protein 3